MNLNLLSADIIASTVDILVGWVYKLLYQVLLWFKEVFDFCYILVKKLAGIDTYYYNGQLMGTGDPASGSVSGDMIEMIIRSDIVRNLFITLLVLGIVLLFIVTFVAVWKTEWDFGKDSNSKTKIINGALRALFNFIAVPVITFFGIFVGNALLRAIDDATSGGKNVNMTDIVLTSIATNALRVDNQGTTVNYNFINLNNTPNENGKLGIYQYFMNGEGEIVSSDILAAFKNNATLKTKGVYYVETTDTGIDARGVNQKLDDGTLVFTFEDKQVVSVFFDKSEFNYVLGYLVFVIMLKSILEITFGLVKRLFYLVFLFLAAPPIVALSPINEKILGEWRKLFISYAASAYITIAIYNIFMSIYPLFDNIAFFPSNVGLDIINGFVSLLFISAGLVVINDLTKDISKLFGVKDLHEESVDKSGNTLWSKAFKNAGTALKPGTAPIKLAGKMGEFATKAKYQGLGTAAKGFGNDLLSGAKNLGLKALNAGPLKDMWKEATAKEAIDAVKKPSALKKEWGVGDTKKAVKEAQQQAAEEIKNATGQLGITLDKNDKNGSEAARQIQEGEQGEKNKKYNENMKIVEEYNKKKLEDKNYKATKEELRAIRSINAHKNFGHAKKHEAENTLIKASQQADALKGKNKVVVSLVKDKNNFASSIEQEVTAKKAKEAMVEQTAKKDAQDKVIQEKYDEIKKLVANSNAVDKSETIEAISKIQKQIQDVQGHSKNKLAEEMNKKIDKLIEDLSKKKK